ncbi:hypothetical protein KHQ06_25695 [Nocardia tengchongensis]|uniref:Uncharacterized protein n=1 Tax=Nocardia tengchongensis TaxID=2055889 RepID=A0ABX8CID8_9NOCA|nr:hypothetical protein [Nocardia tengchongensis]QVI19728.1 hypothetical protein KHQ06_25695 [Nocardia tengchongensis]
MRLVTVGGLLASAKAGEISNSVIDNGTAASATNDPADPNRLVEQLTWRAAMNDLSFDL